MLDIEYSVITSDVIKSFDCITVSAFHIYALHGEEAAKMGGWRLCIK